MSDLPQYYRKVSAPNAGIYQLICLAGYDVDGDPTNRKTLYILKSLDGYLNEAFIWKDIPEHWTIEMNYGIDEHEKK
jgi:hypothetical protein